LSRKQVDLIVNAQLFHSVLDYFHVRFEHIVAFRTRNMKLGNRLPSAFHSSVQSSQWFKDPNRFQTEHSFLFFYKYENKEREKERKH
jgi:hypothetical protein